MSEFYKITYNPPGGKGVSFFTTSYAIIDNGSTIEFFNTLKGETKRFPYILCEIKVLKLSQLPPWVIEMFAKGGDNQ